MRAKKGEYRGCLACGKIFYALPGQIKRGVGRFCSVSCAQKSRDCTSHLGKYARKGTIAPRTAFKRAPRAFKGKLLDYKKIHYRIGLLLGKPEVCSKCGKIGRGKEMHWASKNGNYSESPGDWVRLCRKCHWYYDKQFNRMKPHPNDYKS